MSSVQGGGSQGQFKTMVGQDHTRKAVCCPRDPAGSARENKKGVALQWEEVRFSRWLLPT